MEPVFIYYDKVDFQNDYKVFKVDFSDGDNLEAVFFRKNRLSHNKHVLFYNINARPKGTGSLRRYKKDI